MDSSVVSFAEPFFAKLGGANASLGQGLRFILAIFFLMASWHFGVALVRRRPLSGLSEWGEAVIFSLMAGCAYSFVKLLV
jgi:hypothetical protein